MPDNSTRQLPLAVYDCFTDQRFGGNVGGIVFEAGTLDAGHMQKIAREINAPVTGFITSQEGNEVSVRFFMPGAEIAMCGHVTVGLFTHLAHNSKARSDAAESYVMKAPAGDIHVRVTRSDGLKPVIMMQLGLPQILVREIDLGALAGALGVEVSALSAVAPVEVGDAGLRHVFISFDTLAAVQALAPDFPRLAEVSRAHDVHTVACFSMETTIAGNTLHIRDFCPAVGANEAPASGTTNGALAGYLVRHSLVPVGSGDRSVTILAEQGAEMGRPSRVRVDVDLNGHEIKALRVGGQAIASLEGVVRV